MSSAAMVSFRTTALAWSDTADDQRLFRRVQGTVLTVTAVVCVLLLLWPRPPEAQDDKQALPPPMAKLLLEHKAPPVPKLDKPVDKPTESADAKPKPEVDAAKPEPKPREVKAKVALPPAAVPEARVPQENKAAGEVEAARRKVSGMGLLAAREEIAEVRGAPAAVQLRTDIKQGAGVGSGSGPGVGAGTEAGLPARSVITSNGPATGSGGINTAALSRNTGGGGLAGRATTMVEGVAGGGGGGGPGGGGAAGERGGHGSGASAGGGGKGGSVQRGNSGKASRSIEDIKLVFERNKGAIYTIYNRALREDPGLQGKVVVELKIAPTGEVLAAKVVSSELHAPELEAKLLARIRQFDFGAKDVDQMVVTWPVDFLPS